MIDVIHEGSCGTSGCENQGIVFDVVSVAGVVMFAICGACGVDFRDRCTLRAS